MKNGHIAILSAGHTAADINQGALPAMLPFFIAVNRVLPATILLIPIGFMLFAPCSPPIVLGQKYLPSRVGLSSVSFLPIPIFLLALTLPEPGDPRHG